MKYNRSLGLRANSMSPELRLLKKNEGITENREVNDYNIDACRNLSLFN